MNTHMETIWCPQCETEQDAQVEETAPWWTFLHNCEECGYLIMESEWNKVEL